MLRAAISPQRRYGAAAPEPLLHSFGSPRTIEGVVVIAPAVKATDLDGNGRVIGRAPALEQKANKKLKMSGPLSSYLTHPAGVPGRRERPTPMVAHFSDVLKN